MVNCGTTGVIPDCLGAQNSTWKITYNIPEPGGVRYKYPGNDWVMVINGVRYTTERVNSQFQGGQCHQLYFVDVTINVNNGTSFRDTLGAMWGKVKSFAIEDFPNDSQFVSYEGTQYDPDAIGRAVWRRTGVGWLRFTSFTIHRVFAMNNAPDNCGDPPGGDCIFKVFNSGNQIIYQETRDVCPTAEVVPCRYNPENEKSISVNPGQIGIFPLVSPKGLAVYQDVEIPSGKKATFVKVVAFPGLVLPGNDVTLLELISPEGCSLHPKICWECKPCKKCPENTCLKVLDRKSNKICCYGKSGKVIATVEPECESADC